MSIKKSGVPTETWEQKQVIKWSQQPSIRQLYPELKFLHLDAIATTISNIWSAIVAFLSPILESIKETITTAWDSVKTAVSTAIESVKTTVTYIWNTIKSVTSSVWEGIKSTISSVWDGIKSGVSSAINGVKSTISDGLNVAKSIVSDVLDSIKSKFSSIFDNAKSIVSSAIDTIKGYFNFSWSLPTIKLPHFSISGSFSLNPPSVPHFDISWYKKAYDEAMILSNPTIFGYANGSFLGGGDGNGNEIVAGESHLMNLIGNAVAAQNAQLVALLSALLEATVDGNSETVRVLRAGQVIALNERELGRVVRGLA